MKIINIMLGRRLGGLEKVAIDYHNALESKGHAVKTVLRHGAKIEPPSNGEHAYVNLSYWPELTRRRLKKEIDAFQPDALILHGNRPMKYLSDQQYTDALRIFVAHNYRTKQHVHNMDAVIAVSDPVRDHVISTGYPENRAFTINNMTDMQPITAKRFDPACPVYGMLARLHPVKGVDLFIRALAELKQQGQNFKARIAGDGPERKTLENLANDLQVADRLEFVGWIDDKAAFLQSIDILAAPSRSEAFPVLVVEALAAGIPLVVTDLPGPCSVLTNNNEAVIVPPEDPPALAAAMQRLADDEALRRHMVESQRKIAANFTPAAIANKLSDTLLRVTAKA